MCKFLYDKKEEKEKTESDKLSEESVDTFIKVLYLSVKESLLYKKPICGDYLLLIWRLCENNDDLRIVAETF